jgi:hypothetical protein
MSNHSDIALNMLLDLATEIIEPSRWTILEVADGSWSISEPLGTHLNGIETREIADLIIGDWNTPERQAGRVAAARRAYATRFTAPTDC